MFGCETPAAARVRLTQIRPQPYAVERADALPALGRFLSADPIVGNVAFSQSWNAYSYVNNSPLNFTDPSGFDCSAGMAVAANFLIFERTTEEMRVGKSLPAAIEAGFNRAWNSILDSNVSSLITAGILYWFGSSTIRGFALVLIIGVLVSMFTAIVVTRTILRLIVRVPAFQRASLYGMRDDEFLGRFTGRPSQIEVEPRGSAAGIARVLVGGPVAPVAKGTLRSLPEGPGAAG